MGPGRDKNSRGERGDSPGSGRRETGQGGHGTGRQVRAGTPVGAAAAQDRRARELVRDFPGQLRQRGRPLGRFVRDRGRCGGACVRAWGGYGGASAEDVYNTCYFLLLSLLLFVLLFVMGVVVVVLIVVFLR